MKLKNIFILGLMVLTSFASFAQTQKANPKHINYFKPVSADTKDVKIDVQDAVAAELFAKFKLKLTNKSSDYILYKPQESLFKLESGDFVPQDKKTILIQPLDKESKVIDMKAPAKNAHVDAYTFQLDGLYKIPVNAPASEAPNFSIPASSNDFMVGNFKVEMLSLKKTTAETNAKFKVTYSGNGMGLVEPKKLGFKIESGQIYANDKKEGGILLSKGESETFSATVHIEGKTVDMQFANMTIVWKDTFKDCQIAKLEGATLNMVVDPGLTAGKNK
ncbi:MAG TPA: hypothetical protein VNW06_07225 [Cytophagaceae bacterium]|nr:hypothetical protein [Cytophagaceae bacterium]